MSPRHFFIFAVLAIVCFPTVSLAAPAQKLGKEYVSDARESGIGVTIRPPEGWDAQETPGRSLRFTDQAGGAYIDLKVFPSEGGFTWENFLKEYAALKVGGTHNGTKIIKKGKVTVAGQKGSYIVGEEMGYVFKAYFFSQGDQVYRFQIINNEEKWSESLQIMEKSLATARLLGNAKAPTLKAPKKLGAPYIMTGGKYGFDFRVQPPDGWEIDTRSSSVATFVPDASVSIPKIALMFGREADDEGKLKKAIQLFSIFNDKQLQEVFAMIMPEWEGATIIKVTGKEKIDGKSQGLGIEIKTEELGQTLYGKVVMFEKDGYVYSAVMMTPDGQSTWKEYRSILGKSVQTFRVLE